jgi:hypothetical protein
VGFIGRGISPSQSRYLHTEHHKHKINAHDTDIHASSGNRIRPCGHCVVSRAPKRWAPLCGREETFIHATMLQEDVCMWIYWTQTDSTSYKLVCRLNQSTVRIYKFSSKRRLTRRLPSTGLAKDVPPPRLVSNTGFVRTHTHTGACALRTLSYASLPTTWIPCYKTINSILILGDSRTAWDAIAGPEVRFRVVTLNLNFIGLLSMGLPDT